MTLHVTTATRLIALLGDPVAHSLSPVFQNAAFRAAAVDGVYLALRCGAAEVPGILRGVALAGGGGNVTLPHKELAATLVDRATSAVERTGACNTFWAEDGRVCGDNTDVAGVAAAARDLLGQSPAGARVLLLGAGGSARAVIAALVDEGVEEILVSNRSVDRARSVAEAVPAGAARVRVAESAGALADGHFDLAVNATSLGLRPGDPLPVDPDTGASIGAGLDLVYSSRSTTWVRALTARGIPASDGLNMLIHQGAASFQRWWGRPAPLAAMRESVAPPAVDAQ